MPAKLVGARAPRHPCCFRAGMDSAPSAVVLRYHEATKHRLEGYARGPATLDWDAQPAPFRRYDGAPVVELPLAAEDYDAPFAELAVRPVRAAVTPSVRALGAFFQLSLALSAWKSNGVERWAVRVNPSSGNLHPTEAYLLVDGLAELGAGLYHYRPEDHSLELRARCEGRAMGSAPRLWLGLSSIGWREAWKYGERAFRYCQLDLGHASAALAYAAGMLGWELTPEPHLPSALVGQLLGLDRARDFPDGLPEREEPELMLRLELAPGAERRPAAGELGQLAQRLAQGGFLGSATRVDPRPMYAWPAIDEVARATRAQQERAAVGRAIELATRPPRTEGPPAGGARETLLGRRSGQRYDIRAVMPYDTFVSMLDGCLPRSGGPWRMIEHEARPALVLFVHRVEGLAPGVYLLPRYAQDLQAVTAWLKPELAPVSCAGDAGELGLLRLCEVEPRQLARLTRTMSCHQDIASTSCFTLAMLCALDEPVARDPAAYRRLYREAGVLGHVLYLEAEAHGFRGTGIGCFFDDVVHDLLGRGGRAWQSLYHFAVGRAASDPRIETSPPYAARDRAALEQESHD